MGLTKYSVGLTLFFSYLLSKRSTKYGIDNILNRIDTIFSYLSTKRRMKYWIDNILLKMWTCIVVTSVRPYFACERDRVFIGFGWNFVCLSVMILSRTGANFENLDCRFWNYFPWLSKIFLAIKLTSGLKFQWRHWDRISPAKSLLMRMLHLSSQHPVNKTMTEYMKANQYPA